MPKLIVLQYGDDSTRSVAEAAAAGAKSIRFTEVDLRSTRSASPTVAEYDGIVIVAPAGMTTHADLETLLTELEQDGRATNTVFALAGGSTGMLERLSRAGGIIVTTTASSEPTDAARRLGARAAKVVAWVRHGLGHEAEHHHHHHH